MGVRLKLPNYQSAVVPEPKILDYLLSATHQIGRDKALFFGSFGFSSERWEELAAALKAHAASNEVISVEDSEWGKNYSIIGELESLDGRKPRVRSVWFVEHGGTVPGLITAYPE
jgi:hypothetical protein